MIHPLASHFAEFPFFRLPNFPRPWEKKTASFPKLSRPGKGHHSFPQMFKTGTNGTLRSLVKGRRLPKQQPPPFVRVDNTSFKVNTEGIYIYIKQHDKNERFQIKPVCILSNV